MTLNDWLPWIGACIGMVVGTAIVLGAYLVGEKRGWWW